MPTVLITSTAATAPILQNQRVRRGLFRGEGEKLVLLEVSCIGELGLLIIPASFLVSTCSQKMRPLHERPTMM